MVEVEKTAYNFFLFLLDLNTIETVMTSFSFKISELREKLRIYIYSDPLTPADPFCPTPEGRMGNQKQDQRHNFNEQSSKSTNVFEVIVKIFNYIFFLYIKLFLGFIKLIIYSFSQS